MSSSTRPPIRIPIVPVGSYAIVANNVASTEANPVLTTVNGNPSINSRVTFKLCEMEAQEAKAKFAALANTNEIGSLCYWSDQANFLNTKTTSRESACVLQVVVNDISGYFPLTIDQFKTGSQISIASWWSLGNTITTDNGNVVINVDSTPPIWKLTPDGAEFTIILDRDQKAMIWDDGVKLVKLGAVNDKRIIKWTYDTMGQLRAISPVTGAMLVNRVKGGNYYPRPLTIVSLAGAGAVDKFPIMIVKPGSPKGSGAPQGGGTTPIILPPLLRDPTDPTDPPGDGKTSKIEEIIIIVVIVVIVAIVLIAAFRSRR